VVPFLSFSVRPRLLFWQVTTHTAFTSPLLSDASRAESLSWARSYPRIPASFPCAHFRANHWRDPRCLCAALLLVSTDFSLEGPLPLFRPVFRRTVFPFRSLIDCFFFLHALAFASLCKRFFPPPVSCLSILCAPGLPPFPTRVSRTFPLRKYLFSLPSLPPLSLPPSL